MAHQHHLMMMQKQEWEKSQEAMKMQEWKMQQEFEQIKLAKEGEDWANELAMGQGWEQAKVSKE